MTPKASAALVLALLLAVPAVAQETPKDDDHPIVKKVRTIESAVEKLRGLKFRAHTRVGVKKPEELKKMLFEDFDKEETVKEMQAQEKVLKLFGLVPEDFDLRNDLLNFMSDRIGGFYLPEKKELFLVDRAHDNSMMGQNAKMQEPMAIAHELQHAMQDQHYGLDRWFELFDGHEDRLQAYKSLTEGEAQLIGMTYMMKREINLRQMNRMNEQMMRMMGGKMPGGSLPPYLQENMMFPYTQGAEFFQDLKNKVGWAKIPACFNDPPQSTEQILHPEKYFGVRDDPMEVRLSEGLQKVLGGEDAKELYKNTLGEFNVSILLRELGVARGAAAKGAAGWDGDTFAGYESKDGRTVLIWLSTWDSEKEAAEFQGLYTGALAKKRPNATLERRGKEVLMIDGATKNETTLLARKAFRSVLIQETWRPLASLSELPDALDMAPEVAAKDLSTAMATPRSSTGSTAAPTEPSHSGMTHADEVGASFTLPAGFKKAKDPIGLEQRIPSVHYSGPGESHLRLFVLPSPIRGNEELFQRQIGQNLNDYTVTERTTSEVNGAFGVRMAFSSTDKGNTYLSHVQAIDMGDATLSVAVTLPEGKGAKAARAVVDTLVAGLWLDQNPLGQDGPLDTQDGEVFKVSVPRVLATRGDSQGAIYHSQSDPSGAKVQIAHTTAVELTAYAARLEAQIPLLDGARLLRAGIITRRGRQVYEIEYEHGGRRTHQLAVQAGGRLWSVACSAPAASFDSYRWKFGHVLGNFRVQPGQKYRTPAKKKARQAY
jgi:hypothetical protein